MLGDLLSIDVWERLEALLLNTLEDVVIVEAVSLEGLSKKERDLFALFLGDDWQALDKVKRCRMKKEVYCISRTDRSYTDKREFKNFISIECKYLRDMDNENATETAFCKGKFR